MSRKTGLWLIGAHGGVATTVAVGLAALRAKASNHCGLVSSLPEFSKLDLIDWSSVVIGGHDVRDTDAVAEAAALGNGPVPVVAPAIVEASLPYLKEFQQSIRPGVFFNSGDAIESLATDNTCVRPVNARAGVDHIKQDLTEFKERSGCENVIVINVASTEPGSDASQFAASWNELEGLLDQEDCGLPASSLYAIAALDLQMPFVNFTPSVANALPAIKDLAQQRSVCHTGSDGKTGETFLKSVLAPAFAHRNLEIMSWVGHNIFGNMDGQILDDPVNKKTKVASKGKMLEHMLGYQPQSHISIEYIQSLGDWKTAWDHIHFRGFLGTPMTMQFTWQGCDSILAAPLVLDLFRFVELAQSSGESGLLTYLASFFKSPLGTHEHDFALQYSQLVDWAASKQKTVA